MHSVERGLTVSLSRQKISTLTHLPDNGKPWQSQQLISLLFKSTDPRCYVVCIMQWSFMLLTQIILYLTLYLYRFLSLSPSLPFRIGWIGPQQPLLIVRGYKWSDSFAMSCDPCPCRKRFWYLRNVSCCGHYRSNTVLWLLLNIDGRLEGPDPINRLVKVYPAMSFGRNTDHTFTLPKRLWLRVNRVIWTLLFVCSRMHPCILGAHLEENHDSCWAPRWGAGMMNQIPQK